MKAPFEHVMEALRGGNVEAALAVLRQLGPAGLQALVLDLPARIAALATPAQTAFDALATARAATNDVTWQAELDVARGDLHALIGDVMSAVRTWREVLARHRHTPTPGPAGRAALAIGRAAALAGEHARAEGPLLLALHCARQAGDHDLEAAARRELDQGSTAGS